MILKEFKEFAIKGNAFDLAVGVVIGAAFSQVVNSLVNDLISPPLGWFTGRINFASLRVPLYGSVFLNYGNFLTILLNFTIVSFTIFLLVWQVNRFRREEKKNFSQKGCPFCKTLIPAAALRCPNCTSQIS